MRDRYSFGSFQFVLVKGIINGRFDPERQASVAGENNANG